MLNENLIKEKIAQARADGTAAITGAIGGIANAFTPSSGTTPSGTI